MKNPTSREVVFHGVFKERYTDKLEVDADSMFTLCNLVFKEIFPQLSEESFNLLIEGPDGQMTQLFDPEQILLQDQKRIHIIPDPDGAYAQIVWAIVVAIVAIGVALLLAPKIDNTSVTTSGANFDTVDNIIGQGGVIPVALGTRKHGSRVVSHGIDSALYTGSEG